MLVEAEESLANLREFTNYSYGKPAQKYFQSYSLEAFIEDDHIPFLRKGLLEKIHSIEKSIYSVIQ